MTETDATGREMIVTGKTDAAATRTTTCSIHDETRDATRAMMTETDGIATMMTDIVIAREAADGPWASLANLNGSAKP